MERYTRMMRGHNRTLLLEAPGDRLQYKELAIQAALHSTRLGNYLSHAGREALVQKSGRQQINVLQNVQVFGTRAVAYLPKEQRQGAEQPGTRQCIYLGMSKEVPQGQRLVGYYTNAKGVVVLMGGVFEWETADVQNFPDVFPLRRSEGSRATMANSQVHRTFDF